MQSKRFDKYEKRGPYHWEWYSNNESGYADRVDFVLSHLPSTGTVLDVGGGDGLISYKLLQKGLEVTSIDTNSYGIELAKERCAQEIYGRHRWRKKIRAFLPWLRVIQTSLMHRYESGELQFQVKSAYDLPATKKYDYVVCNDVIEHVPDPKRLLRVIHSVMRNYAIITTPDTTNRDPHRLDYHWWTPSTFSELLSDYQFEFINLDGWTIYVKLYS